MNDIAGIDGKRLLMIGIALADHQSKKE